MIEAGSGKRLKITGYGLVLWIVAEFQTTRKISFECYYDCDIIQYNEILYTILQYNGMLHNTQKYNETLHTTIQYSKILYTSTQYYETMHTTIQYKYKKRILL